MFKNGDEVQYQNNGPYTCIDDAIGKIIKIERRGIKRLYIVDINKADYPEGLAFFFRELKPINKK